MTHSYCPHSQISRRQARIAQYPFALAQWWFCCRPLRFRVEIPGQRSRAGSHILARRHWKRRTWHQWWSILFQFGRCPDSSGSTGRGGSHTQRGNRERVILIGGTALIVQRKSFEVTTLLEPGRNRLQEGNSHFRRKLDSYPRRRNEFAERRGLFYQRSGKSARFWRLEAIRTVHSRSEEQQKLWACIVHVQIDWNISSGQIL